MQWEGRSAGKSVRMKKVIAAGHICLDMTPIFPIKKADRLTDVLSPGKLVKMNGMNIHTGGSAANTGLALKFLGADVTVWAKVGDDELGAMVKKQLEAHGLGEGLICDRASSTSYSVVLAVPGIDRVFLHDPGANDTYSSDDMSGLSLDGVDLFHFGYPPVMKRMYQDDGKELADIFCSMKEKGIATSLDMAAVDPDSEAGRADWRTILKRVLPYVDFFVPSIEEILYMLDKEKYGRLISQAAGRDITEILDMENDVVPIGRELLAFGAGIVLLKCGTAGMYLVTAGKKRLEKLCVKLGVSLAAWADHSVFEPCFKPDRICSGTGAGDTSIAAFLMAALSGEDVAMSVKLAAAEGASCVEAYDALSGLRTMEELKEKIANGWEQTR